MTHSLPSIFDLIRRGALFVVNHSGGKDSQAMLIHLLDLVPREQLLVVHATLHASEWPGALEHARRQAEDAGLPFLVASASKTFLGMAQRRFETRPDVPSFPSSAHRQCTSDLKRGPIQREVRRYMAAHDLKVVVNGMGLRAAESPSRARAQPFTRNRAQSVAGREWYDWLPLHDFTRLDVLEAIESAGQELHPAYTHGNQRLSCIFCIFGAPGDLRNGAIHNPGVYAQYVALEQRTGYTMHQSRRSLVELTGLTVDQAHTEHAALSAHVRAS